MANTTWTNTEGHEEASCARCNTTCNTHPDAAAPLVFCADCGDAVCSDCSRTEDRTTRCAKCHSHRVLSEQDGLATAMLLIVSKAGAKGITTRKLFETCIERLSICTDDHNLCWSVYYALKYLGQVHLKEGRTGRQHHHVCIGEA